MNNNKEGCRSPQDVLIKESSTESISKEQKEQK